MIEPSKVSHGRRSPRWLGNPRQYQIVAQQVWSEENQRGLLPWTWITTACDVDHCLEPSCMTVHKPVRIEYPAQVCVYCGDGCAGVDHLLPKPWTGLALRHVVAVVPSCGDCNSRIGDEPSPSVADRRRRAQVSIERKGKVLLLRPVKTESDMAGLGYAMRSVAKANNAKAERIRARLAWPGDPFYDIRAFQKSGIEDPVSLGLCDESATPLRAEYAA